MREKYVTEETCPVVGGNRSTRNTVHVVMERLAMEDINHAVERNRIIRIIILVAKE